MKNNKTKGITLIALVVTIVVLLILAGITLVIVFAENGIITQANKAKQAQQIAKYSDLLETAKYFVIIEGTGNFDVEKYFEEIEKRQIIEDKEIDILGNEDGTYDITTKSGYVFEMTLLPNKEKPTDAKIEYVGLAGKLLPIIKEIQVSATSTSITAKATVLRLGDGTIEYYYKQDSQEDSSYTKITNINEETGATQSTQIVAGEKYIIKVVVTKGKEQIEDTKEITATKMFVSSIEITPNPATVKVGKEITLTANILPDNATNKTLIWESSDSSKAIVTQKADGTVTVTGVTAGDVTITATATDGSNKSGSCNITIPIPIAGITLNRTTAKLNPGKTITLVPTIIPENAADKSLKWDSSNKSVATVSKTGVVVPVSGVTSGTTIITVTANDDTSKSESCLIEITEESDWEEISKIAKAIAKDSKINNNSSRAIGTTEDGINYDIKVGDIYKVKSYNKIKRVRVIGFKHDDLVNQNVYGTSCSKAGITFDFMDFIIDNVKSLNTTATNSGGWAQSQLRKELNGYTTGSFVQNTSIGGIGNNLSNKNYIKQVKKEFAPYYNENTTEICNDYLWLLSSTEVTTSKRDDTAAGFTIAKEGKIYQFYNNGRTDFQGIFVKYHNGVEDYGFCWWLRSPFLGNNEVKNSHFCIVWGDGSLAKGWFAANNEAYAAPGFCI